VLHLWKITNYELDYNTIEEIINESKENEFVFMIDAFNELNESTQTIIVNNLDRLLYEENLRMIITLRSNSISKKMLDVLVNKMGDYYIYKGVLYESAINVLIEKYGINISKFQDILMTQNPLYIKLLYKLLECPKLKNNMANSTAQITYILEQYVKKTTNRNYGMMLRK
jgi:hypothetical protein